MNQKIIKLFLHIISFFLIAENACGITATYSPPTTTGAQNIIITTTWDDTLACQGSDATILFNIKRSGDVLASAYPLIFQGFTPITNGFSCQLIIPPAPTGVSPNGSFDPFAVTGNFGTNSCLGCANNLGVWNLPNPFPNLSSGFDMIVTVTLSECGSISYTPCFTSGGDDAITECVAFINFNVVPHAELADVATGPLCQGTIFTGTLPPPVCTAQQGFQCPNCIPCTACSGFTFTTAATACTACSGATGSCFCPCNLCSGYTGCPPCTSCVPCTGCTACAGYTGPCGPQPINFVVGGAVGGSVNLVDSTGGIFEFVPNNTFFGTASFAYNVQSIFNPIIFCPAVTGGLYEISYVQNPVASNPTITGCAGTGLAGTLVPFVTGGSGTYTFSQTGSNSCGSVTVNPDGSFTFTAPTGPATTCSFGYAAQDTTPPNCVGTGIVTVSINEIPVAVSATTETCSNQTVNGVVTATNGTPPYTFAIVATTSNGTLTPAANFASTGNFSYTPNLAFAGTDSFTFSVTDSNGCISDILGVESIIVNELPVAGSTGLNGCVNTTLTGNLASLVTGGTGTLIFTQSSNPSCGTVVVLADGTFAFTPSFGFTGNCCFNYNASKGGCAATGAAQVCINVQPGPIASDSMLNICPSGIATGNLNDNIISATPPISFILVSTFGGIMNSFNSVTGDYVFTPTISSGNAGFTFQVDDAFPCLSDTKTVTVVVRQNPTTVTGTLQACDNAVINGNLNPQVTGDTPFSFSGPISQAGGTTIINPNGTFSFNPNGGATGGSFTYEVSSVFGCTGSGTELIIINPAPIATGATNTGCAQTKLTGDLTSLVSGGTPPYINFQLASVPVNGAAMVSSTGVYMFTPNAGVTSGSFNYKVTDSNGCMDTATINISVNPGPTAMTGRFTGCSNGAQGCLIDLVSGIAPFTFTAPVGPVFNGTVLLTDVNNGCFIFFPTFPAPTQGSFNYQVTDSSVPACTSKPTQVFVNIVQGPQASPANFTGCENQPFSGSLAPFVTCGIPPFTFSLTGSVPSCASSIIITPDGEVIFVPTLNFTGPCTFEYCVDDSIPCESCSTVTVNVQPSPVATNSGPLTGCENNPLVGDLNNFMASGTPPFSFTGGNEINGTLALQFSGPFEFTPASIGFASFDYSAIDFNGCRSNTGTISVNAQESPTITGTSVLDTCQGTPVTGNVTAAASVGLLPLTFSVVAGSQVNGTASITPTSATTADFTFTPNVVNFTNPTVIGRVTIRVTASNGCFADLPVIINIHQRPIAGSTGFGNCAPIFTGSLTGLVSGGIPPYIFSQFNGFIPTGCGSVVINPNGSFVYTPNGTGPCTFFYQVAESSTGGCSSTGAVTITTSLPPVVTNLTTCACFNVPVSINLNTLTSGGVPPYTFALVGTPVGGTVFLNPITGIATFKPNPGFNGVGSFQFQAFDTFNTSCASNIGTVTIPVPCCPTN